MPDQHTFRSNRNNQPYTITAVEGGWLFRIKKQPSLEEVLDESSN